MNKHSALRIVAILVIAGVSSLLLRSLFVASTADPPIPKSEIQITATALPAGLLIKSDDLTWREVPASDVAKGQIVKNNPTAKRLLGAVVRHALDDGAVISEKDVVFPDSPGFLAAALQPEKRAVSVAIDDVTGNAGLILPGDRVDLVLTQRISQNDGQDNSRVASETILNDVRVIAVGSVIHVPDADAAAGGGHGTTAARTVTLEVDPRDGEKVTVAGRLGQLSLALRSLATYRRAGEPADSQLEPASTPVWGQDVSAAVRSIQPKADPLAAANPSPAPSQLTVFHGSKRDDSAASSTPLAAK